MDALAAAVRLGAVQPIVKRAATLWLPLAVAVSGLTAMVYGAVQQDLRQAANDPQIQMAEDGAALLAAGASPASLLPAQQIDMGASLAPYIMVFDGSGTLIASSVTLGGQTPRLPPGVFDAARAGRQDRVTWQPAPGVRSAVVVQAWRDGFVVVGRSLRLVEERVDRIGLLIGLVWLLTLGATAVAALVAAAAGPMLVQRSVG